MLETVKTKVTTFVADHPKISGAAAGAATGLGVVGALAVLPFFVVAAAVVGGAVGVHALTKKEK